MTLIDVIVLPCVGVARGGVGGVIRSTDVGRGGRFCAMAVTGRPASIVPTSSNDSVQRP